jgi:hypothetical protein
VLVFAPFAGAWPSLYDQVVRFHLAASRAYATGLAANIQGLETVESLLPAELLAVAAVGVAFLRRQWSALPLVLWAAASLLLLLDQHPLFPHHVALLAPPLAILVAVVAVALWEAPVSTRSPAGALSAQVRLPLWTAVVVAGLLVWGVASGMEQAAHVRGPTARQVAIADSLAAITEPGDEVLSDDQYLVALANRDTPPAYVDTSMVRIKTGYLTAAQLEQAAGEANVRAVLFGSGRFDELPGFRDWVASHYTKLADFGGGVTLYVKAPQTPVAA